MTAVLARGRWSCGFLFHEGPFGLRVALIHKNHGPSVVVGKMNGIGGSIEFGESAHEAMVREFKEEAGVLVPQWREFCVLQVTSFGVVYMHVAHATHDQMLGVRTMTNEPVRWVDLDSLHGVPIVPNLRWLIPMALDPDRVTAYVRDPK